MNAADLLERAEKRAAAVRVSATAFKIASVVTIALALYCTGERHGQAKAGAAELHAALDTNAHRVAAAKAREDTAHRAAVAQTVAVDAHRVVVRQLERRVEVVDSSTLRVRLADSIATIPVPPVVVTDINELQAQVDADSIAIDLWIANDSAHLEIERRLDERTQLLEGAVKEESRAGFWRGVKAGAIVAAVAGVILHVVLR